MKYSIIFFVVVGLLGNCLLTKFIQGAHTFTGSQALPLERNVCGSPFECLACPASYSLYSASCGRFCYRYNSSDCVDWNTARDACQNEGGDLLAPSECNYEFFRQQAGQNRGRCPDNCWLGALRQPNGDMFSTVRGDPISNMANFWGTNQPDNQGENENCLEMRIDFNVVFRANDQLCSQEHGYICQIII